MGTPRGGSPDGVEAPRPGGARDDVPRTGCGPGVVRFSSARPERWRNGGGTTRVLLAAEADDAGARPWRISLADVDRAGPFSAFDGCERVLTVVEGELLLLTVQGREQGLERHRPFRFDGGAPASATLPTGSVRNLNVITAGGWKAHVAIVELSRKRPHPVFAGQYAVFLDGAAEAVLPAAEASGAGSKHAALERYDLVPGAGGYGGDAPTVTGRGFLAVVSLDAPGGPGAP
ncbi:HutD/Ves family protein [Zafaria sp. Z1313]|uniref:HutD/Ves family protein n=1 Tax=unclassified Zafaria TaxID=2828765 RepID=UPI002E79F967|nr:HutD family protein [Zafaria sp. J156]MEE1620023.1 HutD family protein [Zafaria sp. J156]